MRPTPKPSFLLSEVDIPTQQLLVQMADTQGSPSFDGEAAAFPPFPPQETDLGKSPALPTVPSRSFDLAITAQEPQYDQLSHVLTSRSPDQKPPHIIEHEENESPPAKKRRTDGASDGEVQLPDAILMADQHGPGHKIEEELASALGEGVIDTVEPTDSSATQPLQHESLDTPAGITPAQDGDSEINPDVATIISEIMDHTERQEQSVALGPQEIPPVAEFPGARGFAFLKANSHLKIQSLPILDNLVSENMLL